MEKMLRCILHRDPDSEGRFRDERVSVGFNRLSIIDTVGGDQPLFSEDERIVVFTNGEVYNYKEVKSIFQSKGHHFRTGSDCEVIVHLYEEVGRKVVEWLNGIFAFCLYDRGKERLLLGRDRVGVKPLYFSRQDGILIFASEMKAILQASEVAPVENPGVLDEYLCSVRFQGHGRFSHWISWKIHGSKGI